MEATLKGAFAKPQGCGRAVCRRQSGRRAARAPSGAGIGALQHNRQRDRPGPFVTNIFGGRLRDPAVHARFEKFSPMRRLGEHCAWMESSAVVYCNSVLGARTNTEGKESTGAAALTGRIPYWGFHLDINRRGTHLVEVAIPVEDIMDWGLLGYWLGEIVQHEIPVLTGALIRPMLIKLKHFGAAASSSGGVEMYHFPGTTPEARSGGGGIRRPTDRRHAALWAVGTPASLREPQLRKRTQDRLRHARLPAQFHRAGLVDRLAAGRPATQPGYCALGTHAARLA